MRKTFWPHAFIGSAFWLPFVYLAAEYPNLFTWGLAFVVGIALSVWFFSSKKR